MITILGTSDAEWDLECTALRHLFVSGALNVTEEQLKQERYDSFPLFRIHITKLVVIPLMTADSAG